MDRITFKAGEVIFNEGDPGDSAFLIESGAVEISRAYDGEKTVLGEIKGGQIMGEMALINSKPRTATATAKEDTVCYAVPIIVFESELKKSGPFVNSLVLNLINHIRSLMTQLDEAKSKGAAVEDDDNVVFHTPVAFNAYEEEK